MSSTKYAMFLKQSTVPRIPSSNLAAYGTLEDEKAAYDLWGWAYTPSQFPSIPNGPYVIGSVDIHNELEADDGWQNLVMYNRTGIQGYSDLAEGWLTWYRDEYLANFNNLDLPGFFGDHTFGWG